jgi:hypothetical protein
MEKWRYSSIILNLSAVGVSDKLNALVALPPGKEPRYILYRRLIWTARIRRKSLDPTGILTRSPRSSSL